jgi:hypothetical protein
MFPGVPVAFQAPPHRERLILSHNLHLIYSAVTARTPDAGSKVNAVIEVGVIWEHMHPHPVNRLTAFPTLSNIDELGTVSFHFRVTVHAGLGRGHCGTRTKFHSIVAIATVHTKLASV